MEWRCILMVDDKFIQVVNDPFDSIGKQIEAFQLNHRGTFILCNASSKVSDREGISAAGLDAAARRFTPALDAEALVLGRTISKHAVPLSPIGIVSPVVISRACLQLTNLRVKVIDCGSFYAPAIEHISFSDLPSECPSSGHAISEEHVRYLYKRGFELGTSLAADNDYLVIAECVPGGTTTALALLTVLGYDVQGLLSSSLPICNHQQRWKLVQEGLSRLPYSKKELEDDALLAVAAVGDPMQAVVAGLVKSASANLPIYLAGGSQMLAVWALLAKLLDDTEKSDTGSAGCQLASWRLIQKKLLVMSTKWVAFDPSAGVDKLAKLVSAPFVASSPDFINSKHPGLRAYEDGNVKEGVGAGALMCMARLNGYSESEILNSIDNCYDELLSAEN